MADAGIPMNVTTMMPLVIVLWVIHQYSRQAIIIRWSHVRVAVASGIAGALVLVTALVRR